MGIYSETEEETEVTEVEGEIKGTEAAREEGMGLEEEVVMATLKEIDNDHCSHKRTLELICHL